MTVRWDETWHRLQNWTNGSPPSERLAAQILLAEGYTDVDPTRPLGGKDGGKDALVLRNGKRWIMAVYFPRGQHSIKEITDKFLSDTKGIVKNGAEGIAFVTNQELLSGKRATLQNAISDDAEIYHLERITTILDNPANRQIRDQFLGDYDDKAELERIAALQTGGHTFCYWMLYHFDLARSIAQQSVFIRRGHSPLYNLRIRTTDLDRGEVTNDRIDELSGAPAEFSLVQWRLQAEHYYRVFFVARKRAVAPGPDTAQVRGSQLLAVSN